MIRHLLTHKNVVHPKIFAKEVVVEPFVMVKGSHGR